MLYDDPLVALGTVRESGSKVAKQTSVGGKTLLSLKLQHTHTHTNL